MSFVEAVTNVAVGYFLAVLTQLLVFPYFGIVATLADSLMLGMAFTAVSIVRSYLLRRFFERLKLAPRRRTAAQRGAAALRMSEVD